MNYCRIIPNDIANGEGVRVSLFVSGCNRHCPGCFNPDTWDFNAGTKFTDATFAQIVSELKRPEISGLSLLGGDPLDQNIDGMQKLIDLCNAAHGLGKDVWLWTGYTVQEVFNDPYAKGVEGYRKTLLKNCDIVVDGPFVEELKNPSLAFRGSSNQVIHHINRNTIKREK